MLVARDDQACLSGDGASDYMIVVCILFDYAWPFLRGSHMGQAAQVHHDALM